MINIKQHRVVSANFSQQASVRQSARALETAENEGWPMLPLLPESPVSIASAGIVQRTATHLAHHVRSEYRFWSGRPALPQRMPS